MSATIDEAKKLAEDSGFTHSGSLDAATIECRADVYDVCAQNICGRYGKSYACPPHCGSLEDAAALVKNYRAGLVLQTSGEIEDSMDFEGMEEVAGRHQAALRAFNDRIRALFPRALLLTAHHCALCKTCGASSGESCRFPEKATRSIEGTGIVLGDLCKANGMPFHYGPETSTYSAFALLE